MFRDAPLALVSAGLGLLLGLGYAVLGIPHPPGNPLFVLLARTWDLLLAPFGLARGVVWTTVTSLAEGLRGPAMMRPS